MTPHQQVADKRSGRATTRPTFEFSANQPVAFTCQIDGGTPQACASPYVAPSALGDGQHGFAVTATDAQGRTASSGVYCFTVDTKAPKTTIVGHPKKVVKTTKKSVVASFRLKASESPVTFYCQIDNEPLRICGKSFSHRFKQRPARGASAGQRRAGNLGRKADRLPLPGQADSSEGSAAVAPLSPPPSSVAPERRMIQLAARSSTTSPTTRRSPPDR